MDEQGVLRCAMPPRTFGGSCSDGAVDDLFWQWAMREGIEALACAPSFFHEGWRGIAATADIAPGDVILRVPGSLLMSARSASTDRDLCAALETHGQRLTPTERLACHLLHEASKGSSGKWHAYITQLPRTYNLLCVWTEEEIQELQDEFAMDTATRCVTTMHASHANALPTLRVGLSLPKAYTTQKAWAWARSTVSSRTVFVPFDVAGALCPVGDLFNYAPPEPLFNPDMLGTSLGSTLFGLEGGSSEGAIDNGREMDEVDATTSTNSRPDERDDHGDKDNDGTFKPAGDGVYLHESDTYCFHARRAYQENDQIMLCYGTHSNLSLLEHYGFLLPAALGNANDAARIEIETATDNGAESGSDSFVTVNPSGCMSWVDLREQRCFHASNCGTVKAIRGGVKAAREVCARGLAVSPETELGTFQALRDAAGKALCGLPTTAKQDEEVLRAMEQQVRRASESSGDESTHKGTHDDRGAPWEWSTGVASASHFTVGERNDPIAIDENNVWLATRWRLAYKRAVQAAYRNAQARCDEATDALGAGSRGKGNVGEMRVSRPRTLRTR